MNPDSLVSVELTASDHEDLIDLLRTCADFISEHSKLCDVPADQSVLDDLASDFRYYSYLLEVNRR